MSEEKEDPKVLEAIAYALYSVGDHASLEEWQGSEEVRKQARQHAIEVREVLGNYGLLISTKTGKAAERQLQDCVKTLTTIPARSAYAI